MQAFSDFLSFDYPRIPYPRARNFVLLVEKGRSVCSAFLSQMCVQDCDHYYETKMEV